MLIECYLFTWLWSIVGLLGGPKHQVRSLRPVDIGAIIIPFKLLSQSELRSVDWVLQKEKLFNPGKES